MLKPKEKKDMAHKPLSQIGQRKNPFRLGSQVTPKAAQGTSVFDSMQRSTASKTKTPTSSEPKLKPKPIKLKKPVSVDVLHEEYRMSNVPEIKVSYARYLHIYNVIFHSDRVTINTDWKQKGVERKHQQRRVISN